MNHAYKLKIWNRGYWYKSSMFLITLTTIYLLLGYRGNILTGHYEYLKARGKFINTKTIKYRSLGIMKGIKLNRG